MSAVYPADDLEAEVDAVIETLKSGPAVALRKTKQAINAATLTELDGAFARETDGQLSLLSSHDFREGTTAFQQRRAADVHRRLTFATRLRHVLHATTSPRPAAATVSARPESVE